MSGGLFHGFQLWVNLPQAMKMTPPRAHLPRPTAATVQRSYSYDVNGSAPRTDPGVRQQQRFSAAVRAGIGGFRR